MEESPAPGLPQHLRIQMHEAAVSLAKLTGYSSAGTVEFLYDTQEQQFYFLEVNTRLQVEHGVTEEVYGIDLVEWMVLEAAGELDAFEGRLRQPEGHSIQARLYAEDSHNNFAPSSGRVDRADFPGQARVETWIEDSIEVGTLYDPLLAKIIVHGADRAEALQRLKDALDNTKIYGLTSNVSYLRALLVYSDYARGISAPTYLTALARISGLGGTRRRDTVPNSGLSRAYGIWQVGVPPSGRWIPVFRIGNLLWETLKGWPGLS